MITEICSTQNVSEKKPSTKSPGTLVQFAFDVGQRVLIKGSGMEAIVLGLWKDGSNYVYNIAWWYNGSRCIGWVTEDEIIVKEKR